jgi:hypothetical protein
VEEALKVQQKRFMLDGEAVVLVVDGVRADIRPDWQTAVQVFPNRQKSRARH